MLPIPEHTRGQDRDTTPVASGFHSGRATAPVAPGFHSGRASRRNAGFSLTEVLVASAIFITVFSGVILLYQGAVSTVLQGRQAIAAFEQARGSLSVLERDLKRAFTQRDSGDNYQFYGRPEGLMMVGALPNNTLGRITYVVSPAASNTQFQTTLVEPWRNVLHRLRDQVFDAVYDSTQDRAIALAAAEQADTNFRNPALGGYVPPTNPLTPVEFNVVVETQSLLRLQEGNVTSLDAFPYLNQQSPHGMQFPNIDTSIDANLIDTTSGDGNSSILANFMIKALNPSVNVTTGTLDPNRDLRRLAWDVQFINNQQIFAIDSMVIDGLLASRKREAYLTLMAGSPQSEFGGTGIRTLWEIPQGPTINSDSLNPFDFVVTENILRRAVLQRADGGGPYLVNAPGAPGPIAIDALFTPGIFAYGLTAQGDARQYFNDNSNIPGFAEFQAAPSLETMVALDRNIEASLSGITNASYEGTPLAPRLPVVVHAGFWLVFEKPTAGSPDFRRWFTQMIEVPSAATRTAPNRMTPNRGPGASAVAL